MKRPQRERDISMLDVVLLGGSLIVVVLGGFLGIIPLL